MDREEEIAELKRRLAALEASKNNPEGEPAALAATYAPPPHARRGGCMTVLLWCVGIFGALILLIAISQSISPSSSSGTSSSGTSSPASSSVGSTSAAGDTTPTPSEPVSNWTYDTIADPMGDSPGKLACTTSTNRAQLDFPYRPVTADLCIRRTRQHGLDVYVQLNGDGQILCRSYDGCTVHVRFDDKPARANSAAGAADGSSNIVFLESVSRLVSDLKASKTARVQLEFYQAGNQTLEFNTAGLDWQQAKAKK